MYRIAIASAAAAVALAFASGTAAQVVNPIPLASPGMPASQMNSEGTIFEDWGTFRIRLTGEGLPAPGRVEILPTKLDSIVPGATATWTQGPVKAGILAFRAPAYPAGIDVVTLRLTELQGKAARVTLALDMPDNANVGTQSISLGGRPVITLPAPISTDQPMREWGYWDDASALPGWCRPAVACDPAFKNIRAGMNGVPIHYTFPIEKAESVSVVLGICESHWANPGQRPVVCKVEGAPIQEVDPVARWGQHKPGALLFEGKDTNRDGRIDVTVLPKLGSPDTNPILNVIWVFPAGAGLNLDQVVAGKLNPLALRRVDVGGDGDQSLFEPGKVEYVIDLPAKGTKELSFMLGAVGTPAPVPGKSAWNAETLRKAAVDVWRDWKVAAK